MGKLLQDVKYSLRTFARSPGFTAVAVLTLALGIGANTAIFSVVNAVLLRPLPFKNPSRLVGLWETEVSPGSFPLSGQDYLDWQAQNHTFEATTLSDYQRGVNVSGAAQPEAAAVVPTQANFFSVLGVQPLLGQTFEPGEDAPGKNHVVVLGYGFWKRHFGGRADALGKTLELDGEAYDIAGVMPNWFQLPVATDLWIPMDMSPKSLTHRGTHQYHAIGRIKMGVEEKQAQADLRTIAAGLEKQYPSTNEKVSAVVVPLQEDLVGESRTPLFLLLGAVGLVLLVACANVANILLARATGRSREIAVRSAMGATSGRIVRQMLTESVILAGAGAVLGVVGAEWFVGSLRSAESLPILQAFSIQVDGKVLLFTVGVSLFVGILFGLAPALHATRVDIGEELKSSAAGVVGGTGRRRFLRDALAIGEIALSLALLLSAGLLLRTFSKLRSAELGVNPKNVLTSRVVLPPKSYATLAARRQFYDKLLDRLENTPGIEAASISSEIALQGGQNGTIQIEGDMNPAMASQLVEYNYITPDYFRVFQIPLLEGNNFTAEDMHHTAEVNLKLDALSPAEQASPPPELSLVGIISRRMARGFWPDQDPLGKVFKAGGVPVKIIGIADDVKEGSLRGTGAPQIYFPVTLQLDVNGSYLLSVKTRVVPASMLGTVRSEIRDLNANLALSRIRTMDEVIAESMQDTSYQAMLLAVFAALAVLLAAVGIYGVMSYAITQRTHEIGIRMAMGAEPADVLKMILKQGARLALAGVGIGLAVALALTRLIADLLYGVSARDPLTFAGASMFLMGVALLACYIPARRAMRVDPMVALRYE
ncbi:MAG: ABC transporter permease [Candidatus Acidiferrales bacterium]